MKHLAFLAILIGAIVTEPPLVLGDGGMFFEEGQAASLAQTRQEVLLAIETAADGTTERVTYVLASRYTGSSTPSGQDALAFAWVIPVPATPTNVVAHDDETLFDALSARTTPTFEIMFGAGGGCACSLATGMPGELVEVEASGQAGIFEWSALTSTGGNALLSWLNDNGFALPAGSETVLDDYIQQDMQFLAVRVNDPAQIQADATGETAIPPIQFTCETSQRFYPMAISQISAASDTEVLIYVLADHRAEAANVANGTIDGSQLEYDPNSPSLTNYESLFTQQVAELGGTGLITEYVGSWSVGSEWPDAPAGMLGTSHELTRMRTVIAREDMTVDFTFQDAPSDAPVDAFFMIRGSRATPASLAAEPLAALLLFGLFRTWLVRRNRAGRSGAS
jgi:hypothetical protein